MGHIKIIFYNNCQANELKWQGWKQGDLLRNDTSSRWKRLWCGPSTPGSGAGGWILGLVRGESWDVGVREGEECRTLVGACG